jgi:primosomal protein N' (replication factor Y)
VKSDFPYYFNVLVDVPLPAGEGLYTYGSYFELPVGERVLIPLGKKNKVVPGYIFSPAEPKNGVKAILERTEKKYFDDVRASLIDWIMRNYVSSSKVLLNFLFLELLEEAQTKISFSSNFSDLKEKLILKRKKSSKRLIAFLQNRGGITYLKDLPQNRSLSWLLETKVLETSWEPLREQKLVKNPPKVTLFWASWKEQYQLLLELLKEMQKQGRQSLILVPESSLIEPLSSLLAKEKLGTLSFYGEQGARLKREIIFKSQSESSLILLGTWISLFLPFFNLGLVCVLQEESPAYRVLSPPNFQAVNLAKVLAEASGAAIYLFSRAPSLSSYLEAYREQTLIKKEDKPVEREVLHYRGDKGLAFAVLSEIRRYSREGKRTLIFLNRKGYANVLQCEDCGMDFSCPFCGVRLTPHLDGLICHYCGYRQELPLLCPNCRGTNLKAKGIGLEKLEDQLKSLFGDLVISVSSEVARSKRAVRSKIEAFRNNPSSILLGTSILQGHAFPPISLVVLLNLDFSLSLPFYSATERAYQLYKNLESLASEKIILQVSRPLNLDWLDGDFYIQELRSRKEAGFPPYRRLLRILFQAEEKSTIWEAASTAKKILESIPSLVATAPIPCYHNRIKGKWRLEILVRFPVGPVPEELKTLYHLRLPKKVEMLLQLDPEELD